MGLDTRQGAGMTHCSRTPFQHSAFRVQVQSFFKAVCPDPNSHPDPDPDSNVFRPLSPLQVSNYAKPGHRCLHNQAYWCGVPYYAFGLGAASFLGGARFSRPAKMQAYYDWVASEGPAQQAAAAAASSAAASTSSRVRGYCLRVG